MKRMILASTNDAYANMLDYISSRFYVAGPRWRGDSYPEFDPFEVNESEFPDNLRAKFYDCEVVDNHIEITYITQEPFTDDEVQELVREIERCVDYLYDYYVESGDEVLDYPRVDVTIEARDGAKYGHYEFSFGG